MRWFLSIVLTFVITSAASAQHHHHGGGGGGFGHHHGSYGGFGSFGGYRGHGGLGYGGFGSSGLGYRGFGYSGFGYRSYGFGGLGYSSYGYGGLYGGYSGFGLSTNYGGLNYYNGPAYGSYGYYGAPIYVQAPVAQPVYAYTTPFPANNPVLFNGAPGPNAQAEQQLRDQLQTELDTPLNLRPSSAEAQLKSLRFQTQGDEWLARRNWVQAYTHYKQAASTAMELPAPRLRMAAALCAMNNGDLAVREVKRVLRLDPLCIQNTDRLEAVFGEAGAIARNGMLLTLADWVREDIRDPNRLLVMGTMLYLNDDLDQAMPFLKTASTMLGSPQYMQGFFAPVAPQTGAPVQGPQVIEPGRPQINPPAADGPVGPQPAEPAPVAPTPSAPSQSRRTPVGPKVNGVARAPVVVSPPAKSNEGPELVPPAIAGPQGPAVVEFPTRPAVRPARKIGPLLPDDRFGDEF